MPRSGVLAGLGSTPSQSAVAWRLVKALSAHGYAEYSYYSVPDGFALVERLEQIQPDGSPVPRGVRFLDPDIAEPFSLTHYLEHLFVAPNGYYRLIVFVVTDLPVTARGAPPTAGTTREWLRVGADKLPPIYDKLPFTADHQVSVLIFEFQKMGNEPVTTLVPGRLDAHTHLEKAGLYASFAAAPR
ncbi:MAG: hypothetical protein WDN03_02895 [Rhizomicrobium sp.]